MRKKKDKLTTERSKAVAEHKDMPIEDLLKAYCTASNSFSRISCLDPYNRYDVEKMILEVITNEVIARSGKAEEYLKRVLEAEKKMKELKESLGLIRRFLNDD